MSETNEINEYWLFKEVNEDNLPDVIQRLNELSDLCLLENFDEETESYKEFTRLSELCEAYHKENVDPYTLEE